MSIALRASCPNCKLKVTVSESQAENGGVTVSCAGCGKKFGLRFPNKEADLETGTSAASNRTTLPADDPFASLSGALPEQLGSENLNWQDYRVRRKPLIAGKPLAIALSATAAIVFIIGMGIFVSQKAAEIDINAIGDSLLKGPADTSEKIYADWKRYDAEQKALIAPIARTSDCEGLIFPLERLQEKHLNLLVRSALLEQGRAAQFTVKDLPTRPSMHRSEGKSFRSIEAYLTTEFRLAEGSLNQLSSAVLSHLHTETMQLAGNSAGETGKSSWEKTLLKRAVCRALAEAHRGTDESKTAVTIYELAEELKRLKTTSSPTGATIVSTLPSEYAYADFSATQMQTALAVRFTKDPQSEIAKALTVFDQSL